ncbi:MAG: cytidine deaminase [Bryobacteraceae bacterium]
MTQNELIALAAALARPFAPSVDCIAAEVAAALLTDRENVYTGVCVDTECGLGFCAEHSAVAEMLKAHESAVRMIVAVNSRGEILSPCGRCRELLWQVDEQNTSAWVVLGPDDGCRLGELLPRR